MARYTVKFAAGERSGSFLIPLSPAQPCSALIDAVKSRLSSLKAQEDLSSIKEADATLHLEDADEPMLYAGDALQDVLPGAKKTVMVVFEVTPPGKVRRHAQTSNALQVADKHCAGAASGSALIIPMGFIASGCAFTQNPCGQPGISSNQQRQHRPATARFYSTQFYLDRIEGTSPNAPEIPSR